MTGPEPKLAQGRPTRRLFVDESGDRASSHPVDIGKRYLGTIGVAFEGGRYDQFREALEA